MSGRLASWLYRVCLRFLPDGLRREFGAEAADLFAWQLERTGGRAARARFVAGALADVLRQALTVRRRDVRPHDGRPGGSAMDALLHDVRIALRNLVRQPGLTLPIVVTLGLGIGLATAMVAVVQGVLLRPLPYPESDRIVTVRERTEAGALLPASVLNFQDWREGASSFEGLAAVVGPRNATVLGGGDPVRAAALYVSADFFGVAGVEPALGRTFRGDENRPGGPPAVLVSHGFWRRALDANPDLSSARLTMDDPLGRQETWTVIGVMPPGSS